MSNQEKKGGCGSCLGKGCLVLIVIAGILIGVGFFSYHRFTERVHKYTAQSAMPIPVERATQEEYNALTTKMDVFKNASPGSNAKLALTAHDLNTLIALDPGWSVARGKIQVSIDSGNIALLGSIPLAFFPGLRDRFLNGSLSFTPSMENKVLHLNLQGIKLNSRELSKAYVKAFANGLEANLANRLLGDPVIGPVLVKAETLKIENDSVVLTSEK